MGRYPRRIGKVDPHFFKSRIYNYGFKGSENEAKKVGMAFVKLADSPNEWIAMSLDNLNKTALSGALYRKTKEMIVENLNNGRELFLRVCLGRIVNILEARVERKKERQGRYLRLLKPAYEAV
jgi:hypothetical protein